VGPGGIEASELRRDYPDRRGGGCLRALDGLSFAVSPGEVYGLLGPNGAGKTTAVRILATLIRPTGGRARVAGIDVLARPEAARRAIGYLGPEARPYERLAPREQILFYAGLYGLEPEAARARTETLIAAFGMAEFADTPAGRLSTGMRQKVLLARTLVHEPPVLLLDEPTSGVDVLVARRVLGFVAEARERGAAVLLCTHRMAEAERICDRIGILWQGRLVAEGTLAELRGRWGADHLDEILVRAGGSGVEA
jgi:sodium transport system ATP-binding protein